MPTTDQSVVATAAPAARRAATAPGDGAARPWPDHRHLRGAIIVFMGLAAVVIDVSWFLSSQVKMQRAADASALAGVVLLPGNVPGAVALARTEASRNGFTVGVKGIVVTPTQDSAEHAPNAGRHHRSGQHLLRARPRLHLVQCGRHVEGRVHPAGPDGQPGELLRRVRADPRTDGDDDDAADAAASTADLGRSSTATHVGRIPSPRSPAGWTATPGRDGNRRGAARRRGPRQQHDGIRNNPHTSGRPPTATPRCSVASTCRRPSQSGRGRELDPGAPGLSRRRLPVGRLRRRAGSRSRCPRMAASTGRPRSTRTRPARCRPARTTPPTSTSAAATTSPTGPCRVAGHGTRRRLLSTNFKVRLTAVKGCAPGRRPRLRLDQLRVVAYLQHDQAGPWSRPRRPRP